MDDTFAIMRTLEERNPASAVIVGAGYIGLEMAEALSARGLAVTQIEQLPEVLPTVDSELGVLVRGQLEAHGVTVRSGTAVRGISVAEPGAPGRLRVEAASGNAASSVVHADLVLVVTGVRPRGQRGRVARRARRYRRRPVDADRPAGRLRRRRLRDHPSPAARQD